MKKFTTRRSTLYSEYYSEALFYMVGEILMEVIVIATILFCTGCLLESQLRDDKSFCSVLFGAEYIWFR